MGYRFRLGLGLWLAAMALPATPAAAGTPMSVEMKCPIGGKSFTHGTTASYSTWGQRPDGKPYGSWIFPLQLAKCPDNGLVLFDDFTPDDIKRLEPLVESAEYRALRDSETNYFLAAWLMERLGRPPTNVAWMLVQASWQADGSPELKARYQALYVDRIKALPKGGDEIVWLIMQGRGVNGLRELKRFDEAKAMLAALDLKLLDVPLPERRTGADGKVLNDADIEEAERKRSFLQYFRLLGAAIEARDSSAEPLRMIPADEAARACQRAGDRLSESDRDYCASKAIRSATAG